MAIDFLDKVELPDGDASKLEVRHLKTKITALVHDRDRAVTRADNAFHLLEAERAARRHSLSLQCDQCPERLAITCATSPAGGAHAAALYASANIMGWTLGAGTTGTLHQLMARMQPATVARRDLCPACTAAETVAAQQ